EAVATIAWGEENGQWTPAALHAQASGGRLNGRKWLVPSAQIADLFIVAARDEHGPHLFAVERDSPGVDIQALTVNDLTRPLDIVTLADAHAVKLPPLAAGQRTWDAGLILLAADAFGGSRRCLEMARSYALTREQFGQPIAAFQAVKHQLASMAADLEPS